VTEPVRIPLGAPAPESAVWMGRGLLSDARRYVVSPSGRFVLVSCAGSRSAADALRRQLAPGLLADVEIDDREESKSLQTVERIADAAIRAGIRRDDALVAVGGGVVSDVAGFAAAILLRGIRWYAVPTTTGAMADAAIGGKTGVDHAAGKNLLGAFHPPHGILADLATLDSLPDRDFRAGLVEAFKAAWVRDRDLAERSRLALDRVLAREEAPLTDLLSGAARVKVAIVGTDPKEAGERRLLNFGHTAGHAFEAAGGYRRLKHGEAVAWGIAAALAISLSRCGLSPGAADSVREVLARLGPFPPPERDPKLLAPFLARDKKSTSRGLASVLLEAVGKGRIDQSVPAEEWLEAAAAASLPERPAGAGL
jgi:3-dehydroquinate synthetase